ncbi:MAG: adenosine deaminase [Gemmatimonadales bacterium]
MADPLRVMPKAELHVHLDGALRPATLLELAREAGVELPRSDATALKPWMLVSNARDLNDYLEKFDYTISVLQTAGAIERVAYEMVADAAADGLRYLEVRYCPRLSTGRGLSMDDVVRAEWRGLQRGEREFGVVSRIINCALRQYSPQASIEIAEHSVAMRGHGVVGFDLAGPEAGHPPAVHRDAFDVAARAGLGITVHAGEAAGWESIAEAIDVCHATRIGHGTRLYENPALLERVRKERVCLEINITSNVQTRAIARAADHPVRRYFDAGVVVTLCTDSWLMSGVSLTDEYRTAASALGFRPDELATMALAGFEHAFLAEPDRGALIDQVGPELAAYS